MVGVFVMVAVAVAVFVGVTVRVAVAVPVWVGVEVRVGVGVFVAVLGGVLLEVVLFWLPQDWNIKAARMKPVPKIEATLKFFMTTLSLPEDVQN